MKIQLNESDQARIRKAVSEAEGRTSGEIVPYIVPYSDRYEVARWRGAVLVALLTLALAVILMEYYQGWGLPWLYVSRSLALVVLISGLVGALAGMTIPPLKRLLAGHDTLDRAVHQRAMMAFVEEEVFRTRDRTGILLFLSLFEHRIEVVGDTGINQHVSPDEWADVVDHIRNGIRQGRVVDGLVEAIAMCGHLLDRGGITPREDDTNELPDDVRIRKGD